MEPLKVRTREIGIAADNLRAAATAIDEERMRLAVSVARMVKAWEGQSTKAFVHQWHRLEKQLLGKAAALRQAAGLADTLEETYATADLKLAQLFEK